MKWFYDLKLSVKLLTGFVFVALIAGIAGIVGIMNIQDIFKNDKEMYELNTVPIREISDIYISYQKIRVVMRDVIVDTDKAKEKNI